MFTRRTFRTASPDRGMPARSRALPSRRSRALAILPATLLVTILATVLGTFPSANAAPPPIDFNRDIRPILSDHCFTCHGPDENARKGRLRLDTREGALDRGRSREYAIVPGDSDGSEIIRRLTSRDPDEVMPPPQSPRKVTPVQVDLLRRWIDEGASWSRHWAFEPPRRPPLPPATPADRNPIDAFLQQRLAREGLSPSPEAPRATLIRRVTLDLTGLPPSPKDVADFVADPDPHAYERLVDRLLASPRYGERMAWEWLEAARYADSNGYQGDAERTMWPWRDWVVDAFNRNLPYDTFTVWQLAGDRLPEPTHEQRLATGFLRNHMINGEGGRIPEENRIEYLFDQTETVATVWLGATFNCSRCHDHKYDPYSQRDYFSLLAFFDRTRVDGSGGNPQSPPVLEVPSPEQSRLLAQRESRLTEVAAATSTLEAARFPRDTDPSSDAAPGAEDVPAEIRDILRLAPRDRDPGRLEKLAGHWRPLDPDYAAQLDALRQARQERDAASRAIPRVMVMEDLPQPRTTRVLDRGSYLSPTVEVPMAYPATLTRGDEAPPADRLDLARWLVDPDHPLTARVTVNRFWQMFFGIGLVRTSEDFGVQGEPPFHPELLDWLATEFSGTGWDVKRLVRLMVTSAAYRQSSKVTPELHERDPDNRLLARAPRHRLQSWMIRDAALASAGLLGESVGGPPVHPYQPPGVWEEVTFGNKKYRQDHGADLYRRSLYVFWRRIVAPTMFFDVASRQVCTVKTPRTNVPLHALLTLNDIACVEAARVLAQHVLLDAHTDRDRIDLISQRVLARAAQPREQEILLRALHRHRRHYDANPAAAVALLGVGEAPAPAALDPVELAAWTLLGHTVLNLDEALTKE